MGKIGDAFMSICKNEFGPGQHIDFPENESSLGGGGPYVVSILGIVGTAFDHSPLMIGTPSSLSDTLRGFLSSIPNELSILKLPKSKKQLNPMH